MSCLHTKQQADKNGSHTQYTTFYHEKPLTSMSALHRGVVVGTYLFGQCVVVLQNAYWSVKAGGKWKG